jgi:hypothetical protein
MDTSNDTSVTKFLNQATNDVTVTKFLDPAQDDIAVTKYLNQAANDTTVTKFLNQQDKLDFSGKGKFSFDSGNEAQASEPTLAQFL